MPSTLVLRRLIVGSMAVTAIGGCDRNQTTSPPAPSPPGSAPNRSMLADTNSWNAYGADIITVLRNVRADGKPAAFAEIPSSRHVERRLEGNRWHTTMTIGSRAGTMPASFAAQAARTRIVRVEDDGDGSPPRLYNGEGVLIPPYSDLHQPRPALRRSTVPAMPVIERPVTQRPVKPADRSSVQAWILSSDGLAGRTEALQRAFGTPSSIVDRPGFNRYVVHHGAAAVTTVTVDAGLGATVEMVEVNGSDTTLHVTLAYDSHADGVMTLSHERIERPAKRLGGRTILESTYQNVYLAKRN
jgi:hypothetical protein